MTVTYFPQNKIWPRKPPPTRNHTASSTADGPCSLQRCMRDLAQGGLAVHAAGHRRVFARQPPPCIGGVSGRGWGSGDGQ